MRSKNHFSNSKTQVEELLLAKTYSRPITWKDIKDLDLQDDDQIRAEYVEAFFSENEGWDAHYSVQVSRWREETDAEFEKRMAKVVEDRKELKEKRRQTYLTLKREFEGEDK
jgi:hypothetical protein